MKKSISIHSLLLALMVLTISGCAPMLLAGGAIVGAKGYVNDTEHEKQLKEHSSKISKNLSKVKENSKTIDSNLSVVNKHSKTINRSLRKVNENRHQIDALHERINMLESTIMNLQKLLLNKPQPTEVIGG